MELLRITSVSDLAFLYRHISKKGFENSNIQEIAGTGSKKQLTE